MVLWLSEVRKSSIKVGTTLQCALRRHNRGIEWPPKSSRVPDTSAIMPLVSSCAFPRGQPLNTGAKAATKGFNLNINHVAISVPNCDEAVKWYTEILGFRNLCSVRDTSRKETPNAPIFKTYDEALQRVKTAWLATGNGVGFEIFEFVDPKYKGPEGDGFNYTRGGFVHIAVTAPEPEKVCEKVVKAGGKKIGQTIEVCDGDTALYLQDPWGNVIEVMSCSLEQLMANRG